MQQSIITVYLDKVFNTFFHAEKLAASITAVRNPSQYSGIYCDIMQRMTGDNSIPEQTMVHFAHLLISNSSDLRLANRLLCEGQNPDEVSRAKRVGRAIVLRMAVDFDLWFRRGLTLDPWILLQARKLQVGQRRPFFMTT